MVLLHLWGKSQSFIHQVRILSDNADKLDGYDANVFCQSQSFIHQVRILSATMRTKTAYEVTSEKSQSFIHQVRILSWWGVFLWVSVIKHVAILYSSSQNSLSSLVTTL